MGIPMGRPMERPKGDPMEISVGTSQTRPRLNSKTDPTSVLAKAPEPVDKVNRPKWDQPLESADTVEPAWALPLTWDGLTRSRPDTIMHSMETTRRQATPLDDSLKIAHPGWCQETR